MVGAPQTVPAASPRECAGPDEGRTRVDAGAVFDTPNPLADLERGAAAGERLHDLRHSFVAIALANGVTLPEAAMLARHASPSVTLAIYAGVADNARELAVDKLVRGGFGT